MKKEHFADPKANVLQLGLRDGMKIGDFGAGVGHYALPAAAAVGEEGKIYAIDVQEDVLIHLKDSAVRAGLNNVETIWGNFEKPGGTKLKDHILDAAILSNVLFQVEHHQGALEELKRVLKPGGKFLVIDWAGSYHGMGPAEHHVVPESQAEELFITAGFHKVKGFRAGPHHYGIVFKSP